MDFFSHQDRARRRTSWLVALYGLAVAGIMLAFYAVALGLFGSSEAGDRAGLWQPEIFIWVAGGVLAVVGFGSLFKIAQLGGGGSVVARSLGGRPVLPNTTDPDERRLLNVVEEMALAAGVAVPQVYLLDSEPGINAFAAGFTPRDAVIGVTRGCVRQLTRDELQGVIAHEFSHVVNGDMRLNIRLIGVLFGILLITVIGRGLLRTAHLGGGGGRSSRGNSKRGGNPLPLLGLAMIVIGYIGVFFANLIKSAVSRQREFLADASSVQYTRNPDGIANALRRIGGFAAGARVAHARAPEASHLFFGEAVGRGLTGLFATHPPLRERIRRLDPASNPQIASWADSGPAPSAGAAGVSGFAAGARAGTLDLAAARAVLDRLPAALREAARDPVAARALLYALLRSPRPDIRETQDRAAHAHDPHAESRLAALAQATASLPKDLRLPLAELAVPALKGLSHGEYRTFLAVLRLMAEADGEIDLFEYALRHLVIRHVEPAFGKVSVAPVRYRTIAQVRSACETVLAALAVWGTADEAAAAACQEAGLRILGLTAPARAASKASLGEVDQALNTLAEASPQLKKQILEACVCCVQADGRVAPDQADLLRAIADALDVPMPPMDRMRAS